MEINIHFTNQNIKTYSKELYLFYRLRAYAAKHGGWFNGFKFSDNEKYKLLPTLRKLRWVSKKENKVKNYREVCDNYKCISLVTKINDVHLQTKENFKGFVLACAEVYILRKKYKKQDGTAFILDRRSNTLVKDNWDNTRYGAARFKIGKISSEKVDDQDIFIGRAFNDEVSELLEVNISTITRWRKSSKTMKFNHYYYDLFRSDLPGKTKSRRIVQYQREGTGGHSAKHGGPILKDLVIKTSSIQIYINKQFRGRYAYQERP